MVKERHRCEIFLIISLFDEGDGDDMAGGLYGKQGLGLDEKWQKQLFVLERGGN